MSTAFEFVQPVCACGSYLGPSGDHLTKQPDDSPADVLCTVCGDVHRVQFWRRIVAQPVLRVIPRFWSK